MAAATARTSLVEQKRQQWAKEREEMARLMGTFVPLKTSSTMRTTIRTFSTNTRNGSLADMSNIKHYQPRYASTISLRSLASDMSGACTTSLRNLDYTSASLISLHDQMEFERSSRRRSPSLPPIYNKEDYRYQISRTQEPSESSSHQSRSTHRCSHRRSGTKDKIQQKQRTNDEGETSGYASDNVEIPPQQVLVLPCHVNCNNNNNPDSAMGERTWQNPYYADENSLPSSRKLASLRAGEFNRQRWGSVWGQEMSRDPPPPSWLERGLSRLDHTSQVLVINHDSASSPDSSTTGSLGSDTNKTYLRGHNRPVDAEVIQEREIKRQKALELQSAIKQQLEEREKKRREEKEKKLRDERAEEERIQREMDLEKQRLEDEQRRQREKEAAKARKSKAMEEMLEAAERKAKEEKTRRRHHDNDANNNENAESSEVRNNSPSIAIDKDTKQAINQRETMDTNISPRESVRLPISQEVAIVLSGRIENPELLGKSPLKLVNLVVSPSSGSRLESATSRKSEGGNITLSALLNGFNGSPVILSTGSRHSPRLLTPSKYRLPSGRECATQTDCEGEIDSQDFEEKIHETRMKDMKERKEITNTTQRDTEKSTNTGPIEESSTKSLTRINKSQARPSIESRPRWNANRPGTRYRTQSEKDPHYQRRMRLRRRQGVETSDEGSSDFRHSPTPSRRSKHHGIAKSKSRNSARRKLKPHDNHYDADLSMDSLNSLVPVHTDKNGRVSIERRDKDVWCGDDILSHLSSLRNGLIMKKREWDLQECPISPITEIY